MAKINLNVELKNLDDQVLFVMEQVEEKVPTDDADAAPAASGDTEAGTTDTTDGEAAPAAEAAPVETRIVEKRIPLTAANAIIKALIADLPSNAQEDTDAKTTKYQIAKKIKQAANDNVAVSLKSEEITTIKANVGKLWGVMTTGAVVAVLEAE